MQILFAEDVIVLLKEFSSGTLSTNKDVGRVDCEMILCRFITT